MKQEKVSVRLDSTTSQDIRELCIKHNTSTSTMIRTLIKRSINEARNKTTETPEPSTV